MNHGEMDHGEMNHGEMNHGEKNDAYLWDRSGPPDHEVERLERALAPLRYRHRDPRHWRAPLTAAVAVTPPVAAGVAAGVAAAVLAVAAALVLMVAPAAQNTAWQVAGAKVHKGQVLRTGNTAVTLEADSVGRIDLAPHSELTASAEKKLTLQRGELHAFIWAPAREFVVDTPSARAVDLGCEYTLNVDGRGDGLLRVKLGWVAFQVGDREAFIPAGAQCVTHRKGGPGIPYYEDAPVALRNAVAALERGEQEALDALLRAAGPHDGLTLWHLLTRVDQRDRGAVFDRFRELVHLPPEVTREGIVRRDPRMINARMIDLCWNALELENTAWWRGWKHNWSQ